LILLVIVVYQWIAKLLIYKEFIDWYMMVE